MHSVEELYKKFLDDAEKYKEARKQMIELFKEQNPDKEVPAHLQDEFSLPEALSIMCEAIIKK